MAMSATMYLTEAYFNEMLSIDQSRSPPSNRFNYSIHNCSCRRSKIGFIFYPNDIQMKNVILLVCEHCYNYQMENGSAHLQLEKWYFNIYRDSKSFDYKTRFRQNEDKTICFYDALIDSNELFPIKERNLDNWEKETIESIIRRKQR